MGEIKKLSSEELAALREQIRNGAKKDLEKTNASVTSAPISDKNIEIKMAEDRMSVTMRLSDPGDDKYTFAELIKELRNKKIIIGIINQAVFDMAGNCIYEQEVEVAKGKPEIPATDGYYDYFFDTEEHRTPEIREDGSTDYSAVGRLSNVGEGDLIARYHPAVMGESGYDVLGNEKPAKVAKEKAKLRGQFIEFNEETNEYFAKRAGKISISDSNVEILDVHEIKGNVTHIQGKVEFFGDLYIHGDVDNGVVVRAGRNIVIDGTVGAASIYAGGDIILQKGIQGAGKGKVSARGNVYSDFIEYAKVEAGMDVYANSIMNSDISTSGSVIVSGSYGSIIGGDTRGLKGITANAAGNENEIRTNLNAGFPMEEYNNYKELSVKEKRVTSELEAVVNKITGAFKESAKKGKVTPQQKQIIMELGARKNELQEKVAVIQEDKAEIGRKMALGAGAAITIYGDVFRNVMICIDAGTQCIIRKEAYVRYVCKNGIIERYTVGNR